MKSIVILIDYFGKWPGWMPVFLASCKFNSSVDWVIHTDCPVPRDLPGNVKMISMRYDDYIGMVSARLGINFNPAHAYKICDLKPMYGDMYRSEIDGYDFYGFGDLDVIYGDIRQIYTDDILSFDVISTHKNMISGHLALFRNTELLRKAYASIRGWREFIEDPEITRFDEDVYSCLFVRRHHFSNEEVPDNLAQAWEECGKIEGVSTYFKEQYSTVFHPMSWHDGQQFHPDVWYWKNGAVTNDRNVDRQYLYLHLMNFQSMRWVRPEYRKRYLPWKENPAALFTANGNETDGVRIDWNGITAASS